MTEQESCLERKTTPDSPGPDVGLHPLPIPKDRWSVVLVDFILGLPDRHSYNAVMVVVDSVEKKAHFIPTTATCSALGAANLYQKNV